MKIQIGKILARKILPIGKDGKSLMKFVSTPTFEKRALYSCARVTIEVSCSEYSK